MTKKQRSAYAIRRNYNEICAETPQGRQAPNYPKEEKQRKEPNTKGETEKIE